MRTIVSDQAAPPVGPYSPAMKVGKLLFVSGQIPVQADGSIAGGDIEGQTRQVFLNLVSLLESAGGGLGNVAKTTVFLKDMGDFGAMNDVYAHFFESHRPARSTVEVARLPRDVRVEIEAIAYLD